MLRRLFLLIALSTTAHASAAADEKFWAQLKQGGHIVLMRHAQTVPGVGDPPDFVLGDCGTQRNLSAGGRADARQIGAEFRRRAIPVADVLSAAGAVASTRRTLRLAKCVR